MLIKRLFKSFKDALRGLAQVFRSEQNFRIQVAIALMVIILAFYFPLKTWEIILTILMITMVLTMELINTMIEYFIDLVKPRMHHYVFLIKDMMAAAVLVTALGAALS